MLIAVKLLLRSDSTITLPRDLGRACYAEALAHLKRYDPRLSSYIHALNGIKPITCSGIDGAPSVYSGTHINAKSTYTVRITAFESSVAEALRQILVDAPPIYWIVHGHRFFVQSVTADAEADPWTGIDTFEELAVRQASRSGHIPASMTLAFASPVAFRSNAMNIPLPLPDLVLGSLVERWNAFSPITLGSEIRDFGREMVAVSRYQLESQPFAHKNGATRIGGVGTTTYRALGGDEYWLGVMQILGSFAKYGGIGVQTTSGMGQACQVSQQS